MNEDDTHKRVPKAIVAGLKDALKKAKNGTSMDQLIETILSEALAQIQDDATPPRPLPIIETLRRQRGLGAADSLRTVLENRDEISSIVREEAEKYFKNREEKKSKKA